jgi:hypothetical protein
MTVVDVMQSAVNQKVRVIAVRNLFVSALGMTAVA